MSSSRSAPTIVTPECLINVEFQLQDVNLDSESERIALFLCVPVQRRKALVTKDDVEYFVELAHIKLQSEFGAGVFARLDWSSFLAILQSSPLSLKSWFSKLQKSSLKRADIEPWSGVYLSLPQDSKAWKSILTEFEWRAQKIVQRQDEARLFHLDLNDAVATQDN